MLHFSNPRLSSGAQVRVKIYFYNESGKTVTEDLPANLTLQMKTEQGAVVYLDADEISASPRTTLVPWAFLTKEYRVLFPKVYRGVVQLAIVDHAQSTVLIDLNPDKTRSIAATVQPELTSPKDSYPTFESLFSLYQNYVANFSAYDPMYFLVGADPENSKFQISFKYRPLNPAGSLSTRYPWMQNFYFAYTQTSFWDLKSNSAPFQDTSYKPELFYLSDNIGFRPSWMQGFFLQGGLRHESNGRGGIFSRSTNTIYLKPTFIFYNTDSEFGLQISPLISGYFKNDDETNPDLAAYLGRVELGLKFGKAKGLVSAIQFRFAEQGLSVQTEISYPISKLLQNNLDIYFYLQYSNALAESLIDYRERTRAFRIGIAIVR